MMPAFQTEGGFPFSANQGNTLILAKIM